MTVPGARATDDFVLALVLTVAGLLVALVFGKPEAAILVAPWAVVLVLGARPGRRPRLTAELGADADRCVMGDDVEVSVRVALEPDRAPGPQAWVATVRPTTGWGLTPDPDAPTGGAVLLGPGRSRVVTHRLEASQWGNHVVGEAKVELLGPHGLLRWSLTTGPGPRVRVHPPPRLVRQLVTPHLVRRMTGAHRAATSDRGVEYADLRPYAPGDVLRDIDWRASARAGELWVAQRHPDRTADVILLVDSFVESGHDVRRVFGLTIEAALALADGHLARVDRVGLVELGGVVRWVGPATGRLALQRLTDALLSTRLYATSAERDLEAVPPRALPPRSFIIGISPLLDERYVENLVALRAGGHDVAVIECVAPVAPPPTPSGARARLRRRSGTITRVPTEVERLARRLWEAERAMTRDRLAELGVAVGRWDGEQAIDPVLIEVVRRRRHLRTVRP